MPRLSIVIPCQNDTDQFENTLISVLQNRPRDCEVLVTYAGTYPDPYDLKSEVRFVETRPEASLLELMNVGWARCSGDVVHILQCGVLVDEGWTDAALARFDTAVIGSVSPFLDVSNSNRIVAGVRHGLLGRKVVRRKPSSNPLAAPFITGPTLAAGFYRKTALEDVGGFDVLVGKRCGDIDIALELEAAGYDAVCEPASFVAADHTDGPRGFGDGRRAERLFWKHLHPQEKMGRITLHLFAVVAELVFPFPGPRSLLRFLGRLVGSLEPRVSHREPGKISQEAGPPKPAYLSHPNARPESRKRRRNVA